MFLQCHQTSLVQYCFFKKEIKYLYAGNIRIKFDFKSKEEFQNTAFHSDKKLIVTIKL